MRFSRADFKNKTKNLSTSKPHVQIPRMDPGKKNLLVSVSYLSIQTRQESSQCKPRKGKLKDSCEQIFSPSSLFCRIRRETRYQFITSKINLIFLRLIVDLKKVLLLILALFDMIGSFDSVLKLDRVIKYFGFT